MKFCNVVMHKNIYIYNLVFIEFITLLSNMVNTAIYELCMISNS